MQDSHLRLPRQCLLIITPSLRTASHLYPATIASNITCRRGLLISPRICGMPQHQPPQTTNQFLCRSSKASCKNGHPHLEIATVVLPWHQDHNHNSLRQSEPGPRTSPQARQGHSWLLTRTIMSPLKERHLDLPCKILTCSTSTSKALLSHFHSPASSNPPRRICTNLTK